MPGTSGAAVMPGALVLSTSPTKRRKHIPPFVAPRLLAAPERQRWRRRLLTAAVQVMKRAMMSPPAASVRGAP